MEIEWSVADIQMHIDYMHRAIGIEQGALIERMLGHSRWEIDRLLGQSNFWRMIDWVLDYSRGINWVLEHSRVLGHHSRCCYVW